MSRTERVLQALCDNASVLTEELGEDCCVEATRFAIDVVACFGMYAEPLVVTTTAWNDVFIDEVERLGGIPPTKEGINAIFDKGGHSIGCGFMVERDEDGNLIQRDCKRWAGHLVAVVGTDKRYLLDMTLRQISRPLKGMTLEPLFYPVPFHFAYQSDSVMIEVPQDGRGSALLIYNSYPDKDHYKQAGGWTRPDTPKIFVPQLFRKVKESLGEN